jgi:hypothetical protein
MYVGWCDILICIEVKHMLDMIGNIIHKHKDTAAATLLFYYIFINLVQVLLEPIVLIVVITVYLKSIVLVVIQM